MTYDFSVRNQIFTRRVKLHVGLLIIKTISPFITWKSVDHDGKYTRGEEHLSLYAENNISFNCLRRHQEQHYDDEDGSGVFFRREIYPFPILIQRKRQLLRSYVGITWLYIYSRQTPSVKLRYISANRAVCRLNSNNLISPDVAGGGRFLQDIRNW